MALSTWERDGQTSFVVLETILSAVGCSLTSTHSIQAAAHTPQL